MGMLDKLIFAVNPQAAYKRAYYKNLCRGYYDSAAAHRDGWNTVNVTAEQADRGSRDIVRARARDLERNDDNTKAIILDLERNVVGTGISLQAKVCTDGGEDDDALNNRIEREWKRWCKKGTCTVDERHSFREVQKMCVRRTRVDGGLLILKCYLNGEFRLQMREVDDLDTSVQQYGGNRVVGGIELDTYDRIVAYYLKTQDAYGYYSGGNQRVDAKNVLYVGSFTRPTQVREFSPAASSLARADGLNQLTDAAIMKERVQACYGIAIEQDTPGAVGGIGRGLPSPADGGAARQRGALPEEHIEPGMIMHLKPGEKISAISPAGMSSSADGMMRTVQRSAGAGAGLSYEAVSRDMSQTNYSSARQGMLQDKKTYEDWQATLVESVLEPVYREWLSWAVLSGRLSIPDFWSDPQHYAAALWIAPGMDWIDPLKEVNANAKALDSCQTTLQQICAAKGNDWREVVAQRAAENEYIRQLMPPEKEGEGKNA